MLFFFSSRRRHTRLVSDWSSDVCSSDLYPENKKWDGRFRKIRVKVNRTGIKLRYRLGYFALDPQIRRESDPKKRSEERRVGKECRCGWWAEHEKRKEVHRQSGS